MNDVAGTLEDSVLPNQGRIWHSYSGLSRLLSIFLTLLTVLAGGARAFCANHDRTSNVIKVEENSTHAGSLKLFNRKIPNRYDKTYRLGSEKIEIKQLPSTIVSTSTTSYTYDDANNRITKSGGGPTITYTYGSPGSSFNSNQLVSWTDIWSKTVSYTYDANGSRKTRREVVGSVEKEDVYTWNPWKRLATVVLQSGAAGKNGTYFYQYDHRSRRVSRNEAAAGGVASSCSFSGSTTVLERTSAGVTVEYVRGPDMGGGVGGLLYSSRSGTRSWAHTNGRGDVVARTALSGALTFVAHYEAFGKRTQELGSTADPQRANTKEEDPTGLLNEGHRYRDLETGMFISRDPAGFVDGPNVYSYVRQNPWSAFDPEGLWGIGDSNGAVLDSVWNNVVTPVARFGGGAAVGYVEVVVPEAFHGEHRNHHNTPLGSTAADMGRAMGRAAGTLQGAAEMVAGGGMVAGGLGGAVLSGGGATPIAVPVVAKGAAVVSHGAMVFVQGLSLGPVPTGSYHSENQGSDSQTGPTAKDTSESNAGKGPALPDEAWNKNAPHQVTPGTKQLEHTKYNTKTKQPETSTVEYDDYGRQVKRTDNTDHGYGDSSKPDYHSTPHDHTYKYGPGYGPKGNETRTNR